MTAHSSALRGKPGVHTDNPAFVSGGRAPGQSLRDLTQQALRLPHTAPTRERLRILDRPPMGVVWTSEDDAVRDAAAAIRRETLTGLEGYLASFTAQVQARGGHVHRASTPAQARSIVTRLADEYGVRLVAKSKSMAAEEIGLNQHLQEHGIEVVETDLGEHIIQLRDERPSQLVAPAIHLSTQDVAEVFNSLGETVVTEPEPMVAATRERLRPDFRDADMGITGVNFAAADTGTMVIVTNEGNADHAVAHPKVHVAVMTVEKVIPRLADIGVLVPLLCRAAGDRELTAYQTLLTGPRRPGETDGPEHLHVVIVDNGRTRLLGTEYAEALACIRCGNCQMSCPVFKAIGGGHGYGSVYGGPIGAVLSPLIGEPDQDADLPFLSSLCGACGDACPVRIPLPDLLVKLRARYTDALTGPAARAQRAGWAAYARAWSTPGLYRLTIAGARVADFLPRRMLAALPVARAWAAGRVLPPLARAGAWRRSLRAGRQP